MDSVNVEPDGDLLYQPSASLQAASQLADFIKYAEQRTQQTFVDYATFERFCLSEFPTFWSLFVSWSAIICEGSRATVCTSLHCEYATFFPDVRLNYAENVLKHGDADDRVALIGCHFDAPTDVLTRAQVRDQVIRLAISLRQIGVSSSDRIVMIARNNIQVVIAALACAAIGATFSSCSHDVGVTTALARFQQLHPKLLLANFAAKSWDSAILANRVVAVVAGLPSLSAVVALDDAADVAMTLPLYRLATLIAEPVADFAWPRFSFNHPLCILFSSGTTGVPKCIMHGAGGILLEHLKEHRLHGDLTHDDRMFFQTSCGWMMWNWQLSALGCGASIVVYDGPLGAPETLWRLVADHAVTVFGTNPAYLQICERSQCIPRQFNLQSLRSVLSTGSILYPKQFRWVVEHVKRLPVQSISGGTDILGCFVLGNPLLPVYAGQAQCRSLGLDVRSIPAGAVGDLICTNPFPSRPLGFYGEPTGERYHQNYFAANEGVWTHGDLIEFTPHGAIMHGRSDAVMNIRGVRVGPVEIYHILQAIPAIVEAMAVEQTDANEPGGTRLILLVVLRENVTLDSALTKHIRTILTEQGNAVMVPAAIIPVDELPVTHNGKRSEIAARDAVNGLRIRNRVALVNPGCLDGLPTRVQDALDTGPAQPIALDATDDTALQVALCGLCQHSLKIDVIRPTDNFHILGGDSLTILGFLMDVLQTTQTSVPLSDLVRVSTIQALVRLLQTGETPEPDASAPTVRPIAEADTKRVVQLLDEGFERTLPWTRLLDHPWQDQLIPHAYVLEAGGDLVGFLGLICTHRVCHGKAGLVANLTSWYVRPAYRSWSNMLLAAAFQHPGLSFTSLTPSPTTHVLLKGFGFSLLDQTNLFLPPMLHASKLMQRPAQLLFDRQAMDPWLTAEEQQLIADHAPYDCLAGLLVSNSKSALIITRRRVHRTIPLSEVMGCTDPNLLYRHLEQFKLAVMLRQRTLGLSVSQRLFGGLPRLSGIKVKSHNMYRSSVFEVQEIDKLYSELMLLPL